MTTMSSASWSASSRYCVVSRTVVPSAHQLADHAPQLVAALRVEAGRRLVEEQHRRPVHQRGGEVEPPPHPARVGAHRPVAGVGQREAARAARRPGAGCRPARRCASRPTSRRFSRPVRFSSTAAYWPARPIAPRTSCGSLTHVDRRAPRAVPASGRSTVVRIRTAVVLPAPLGPSNPKIVPSGISKSIPARACTSPNRFVRPVTRTAVVDMDRMFPPCCEDAQRVGPVLSL